MEAGARWLERFVASRAQSKTAVAPISIRNSGTANADTPIQVLAGGFAEEKSAARHFNRCLNVTQCLSCLLKKTISSDNFLSYVPSCLSRDEYDPLAAGADELEKPMLRAREKSIRIDVFLGHKLMVARVARLV